MAMTGQIRFALQPIVTKVYVAKVTCQFAGSNVRDTTCGLWLQYHKVRAGMFIIITVLRSWNHRQSKYNNLLIGISSNDMINNDLYQLLNDPGTQD
jgi:hypothetical protein